MNQFKQKTEIIQIDKLVDGLEILEVGDKDLIITSRGTYNRNKQSFTPQVPLIFYDDYGKGEPTDTRINKIIADVNKNDCKRIIAIGGGTVLDIAKLCILKDVTNCVDAFNRTLPLIKAKELVCIPTTCGTGSEVTPITVAELTSLNTKMGLSDPAMQPDSAVLIPELLKDLPFTVWMHSAVDALVHAAESYLSPKANEFTEMYSLQAVDIILKVFVETAQKGEDSRHAHAREMLLASTYAGIAFANAGCGPVHALSYPLGTKYHVAHGEANAQFFTSIFTLYEQKNPSGKIKNLAEKIDVLTGTGGSSFEKLDKLLNQLKKLPPLEKYGMTEEDVEAFTKSVIKNQQRLLGNRYTEISDKEIFEIYKKLFKK